MVYFSFPPEGHLLLPPRVCILLLGFDPTLPITALRKKFHRDRQRADDCFDDQPPGHSGPTQESLSEYPATASVRKRTLDSRPHPTNPAAIAQGYQAETLVLTSSVHSG